MKATDFDDCEIRVIKYWDHHRTGWTDLETAIEDLDEAWLIIIGWVVKETPEWIILMEEWSQIQDQGNFTAIRKADIIKSQTLIPRTRKNQP